jgi:predicted transglutaminase-like protease
MENYLSVNLGKAFKAPGKLISYLTIIIIMTHAIFSIWITWFLLLRKEDFVAQAIQKNTNDSNKKFILR